MIANIEIKEVDVTTENELEEFILFPTKIYKDNCYWVQPITKEEKKFFGKENPLWKITSKKLFIATKQTRNSKKEIETEIVGRIALFIDSEYTKKEKVGYFGYFECVTDKKVANALFFECAKELRKQKIRRIRGPINGSVAHNTGILVKGFNEIPGVIMNYNPAYYSKLISASGFKKVKDLYAYRTDLTKISVDEIEANFKKEHKQFIVREINIKKIEEEIWKIAQIINKSFTATKHFQFRKYNKDEFIFQCSDIKYLFDKDFMFFLHDEKKKQDCGIVLTYPNYNLLVKKMNGKLTWFDWIKIFVMRTFIRENKLELISLLPEYRGKGLGKHILNLLFLNLKKRKFETFEYSWITEDNIPSIKLATKYGGVQNKIYRVYEKKI
ncbi:GNAT family N-acetyltransferase [Candidatus Woesearchaeota archaeon]|nr:GNAT family N-acetyltransferase [Candidatus Woesearchaeota archaeon]MBT6520209.1 GNAT family N-acetyltransferase [Candidatus Woesearchaeota archaeon]MBT7367220.1 GNAT family N-acetyltransferase [Candidatus Woesearchaeota archaeon]